MDTLNEIPKCPQCKSNENVKEVKGCRCMSCPPWICMNCEPHVDAGHKGYEFFDDDDEEYIGHDGHELWDKLKEDD